MTCPTRTEAQETVCTRCGARWDFDDEPPACDGTVAPGSPLEAARVRYAGPAPSTWKPETNASQLAARLRNILSMQAGQTAVALTPALVRDILAELEKAP